MIGLIAFCAAAAAAAPAEAAALAGYYEGNQAELAAGLELGPDGRFRYGLAYGALNEGSEGSWAVDGDRIRLTSDPVTAPVFRLAEEAEEPARELVVELEPSSGLPVQLFDLIVQFADGDRQEHGFGSERETIAFEPGRRPVSVQISFPMFDLLSQPAELPAPAAGKGHKLRFVFEPNDLGKVAFASAPLRIEEGELLLERHDRLIRFRRVEP